MDLTNLNRDKKNRKKAPPDLSTMIYGKVPPQAKDLEEAVLGAIMNEGHGHNEGSAFDRISDILKPESFYVDSHQRIFNAMRSLANKSQPIDILTVVEELRSREELDLVGGPYYVTRLTNAVVSSANIEAHSRIITQKFIQRELIRIGGEMVGQAYEDSTDVFDLLDQAEANLYSITVDNLKKDFSQIGTGLVRIVQRIEELRHSDEPITGVPSGFPQIDSKMHGWQPCDLIIIAARPSVGKTAFALNLARNAALHATKPTPVGIFSLEMSEGQLIQRILSAESEIWLERIKTGKMEEHHMKQLYTQGIQRLSQAPIFIDDTAGLNMFELRAKARRMINKYSVGLIIVDYLQLMTGDSNDSKNREREISKISRELKKLAKDLGVPLIALSQLSREVEKRGKGQKVPQLSDLRESGAIEQDADIVMFLYRPPEEEIKEDAALAGKGMVKVAKFRDGALDDFVLAFKGEIQKWMELSDYEKFHVAPRGFIPVPKETNGATLYIAPPQAITGDDSDDELPF